jgi:hypothetical protein
MQAEYIVTCHCQKSPLLRTAKLILAVAFAELLRSALGNHQGHETWVSAAHDLTPAAELPMWGYPWKS